MMDINALDFVERFDPAKAVVGVVGYGYVGKAVESFFVGAVGKVAVRDVARPDLHSIEELVQESQLIFVCVPTPMNSDGSCHTAVVEGVLRELMATAAEVGRNPMSFVVVLKSTVPPGFTEKMKKRHPGLRLLFSPEFLTEKNSIEDFANMNRVVLGGDIDDARVAFKFFEARLKDRVNQHPSEGGTVVLCCQAKSAELAKLFTNAVLATKVVFANEMYGLCRALDVSYEEVRSIACLDERIGASHLRVPGHDGHMGFGGSCFPKDINNLRDTCRKLGVVERLFTAVIERNDELRPEKDWEELKGRAVVGKDG